MSGSFGQALVYLIHTLGNLYLLAILLRFLLQAARADFYNPVTQAIVKITTPVIKPFRRMVPGYRGFDFASLVAGLVFGMIATYVMLVLVGAMRSPVTVLGWAALGIVDYILNIYFWAALVSAVASFIAPFSGHPVLLVIHELLEPAYKLFRKVLPPMAGLDLSPLFIFLGTRFLENGLVYPIGNGLGLAPSVVLGFW
jgi:YggT family protein